MARWQVMIFKLALRNILGNGWRSLINMIILAIVMIAMIWMQSMYYSWIKLAETEAKDWEIGIGQLHQKDYDRFDAFSWDSSFADIPEALQSSVAKGDAVPVLLSPAVLYANGRMNPLLVKGIPSTQKLLKMPTALLRESDPALIPAIIGKNMAKSSQLKQGDIVVLRIKDSFGSFNALDLMITEIMNSPVPTTDAGLIWIDLSKLQEIKALPNKATLIVLGDESLLQNPGSDWISMPPEMLLADLYRMMKTETGQQNITFALLLFLGMIAIFDTQVLALFKRRKEIGTLSALGMTKRQIVLLFTTEGVMYMWFSIFFTFVLGFPLFWYYAVYGYRMPSGFEDMGVAGMSDAIHFQYPAHIVFGTILFVFVLTALVSWIPASRIARMNPTDALRGKIN